ncbi:hypothetical protein BABINDRAFT_160885 [Babjeviella inositovora NRRL Y-12698]|uniref:UDP-N-acetylglucosamine diphosphorylase n=1 Tax=Babjeviella inositovora NRRL Y-12698 TaxID=984486 RepID=A0A1E3QUH1_9ASCO|nr:uncharacterized protein BABINDRAFT_160885 [Babjeviella inositovora NRRL Y-12698]ODQ80632.1 hypothetical protein BABINDRAFT_160885 [Babjeviella inositovora NRRL Y-12698]
MTTIKEQFVQAGQKHLFQAWDALSTVQQASFEEQLSAIANPQAIIATVQEAIKFSQEGAKSDASDDNRFDQLPASSFKSLIDSSAEQKAIWFDLGLQAISRGEVGVLLMAGGQGTRLGSSKPKGCFNIELPSGKSLFQIQAEKLLKVTQLANEKFGTTASIPWYIMTSGPTRADSEQFFQEHQYFGIDPKLVTFFNQGTLPCFNTAGDKILPLSASSINESPDGNGGLYKGIYDHKLLEDFAARNLKHLHMYSVDNVLVKIADPMFIGFSIASEVEIATKAVRKRDATESVGLIVVDKSTNSPKVIEYSEISAELAGQRDPSDPALLKLRAANIVNHYYSVALLTAKIPEWISSQKYLPYHIASKKIPTYNFATGEVEKFSSPNGIKLEQFIFDVFPSIDISKFGCLEVAREEEFSPLKNGLDAKSDNAHTSRDDYLKLGSSWVKAAGAQLAAGALVEVSSLTSYGGEGLDALKGKKLDHLQQL